ncbi:MAG: MarR family transcriptional regulator [Williamsia herbipolensis]|uniref:DNA-binding transcriptional regulator, MarR family n=1 Tax=Williamsia serinedens TaxID=391736 RepID=A0ABT1H8B5_9NOCA|nr:MarR family transcriptional regulator [Williamsia serinedens]MBE7160421.1 MarR family transcriptional regulator [Williamsia herbipolensis]MCP2162865.1 DNA-binding transcriptional regulator, MarR family [Williamsia serinedens]
MAARSRQQAVAEVGTAMQRYQRSVQAFDDAVGRRLGLGPADLRCLDWLSEGPLTAKELATATGLRPAATTALIDRLEAKGLLRRSPSPDDRRRVLVEMTEEGRDRVWEAWGPMVVEGQRLFDGHTVAQLDALTELLERMTALTETHRSRIAGD